MLVDESAAAKRFDVLLAVDQALEQSCYSAIRGVCYGFSDGRLVLEGKVNSYFMKQLAQTLVASVADEHLIDNRIQVDRPRLRGPHPRAHFIGNQLAGV